MKIIRKERTRSFKRVKVLLVEVWATSARIVTVVSSGSSDTLGFSAAVKEGKVK